MVKYIMSNLAKFLTGKKCEWRGYLKLEGTSSVKEQTKYRSDLTECIHGNLRQNAIICEFKRQYFSYSIKKLMAIIF